MPRRREPPKRQRKQRKEPEFSTEEVLRAVQRAEGRSANLHQLLEQFDATPTARRQLKDILAQLVRDGRLSQHRGNRFESAAPRPLVEGTIMLHRDGYGFVIPKQAVEGIDSDIFIPAPLTGPAMNGDTVQVEITFRKAGGRAEGRVVSIARRARDTIVGQLRFDGKVFFVAPSDEKLPAKILIIDDASEHKDKIVEVEITRFPSQNRWPAGRIVNVIGFIDDPNVETQVIIRKFGLPTHFPAEVEREAASLPDALRPEDFAGRDDMRKRPTITIDPATARDFDDAVDIEVLADGSYQLGVHIADVSHFVPEGSAMDREARVRGTSVYFPDRVIPMLPEKVSNHLCSLNPKTDRLAFSVMIHLAKDGSVKDYSFHNSIIFSKERMNYDDVQKIIDGDQELRARYKHILSEIQKIERVAGVLYERRQERGAIDFDLPEPILTYSAEGDVTGIVKAVRHFSHRIIEEFMILANEVVARHLESKDVPSLYRIHEDPDPGKVEAFAEIAEGYGLRFRPRNLAPAEFQKFVRSIEGRPEERLLSYLMLRSFKQAIYSAENAGHFGLASDAYTHFTSPIRRYPDLVVHRILKNAITRKGRPSPPHAQLEAIASESTERERTADQAERELFEWKRMILLERHLGETFEAIVIAVWKEGFTVELVDQFVEGVVPLSELEEEYRYDPQDRMLVARSGRRRFKLGDRITVQVARIDKLLRRAYFLPVLAGGKRSR